MKYSKLILDASNFYFRNFDESDNPVHVNDKWISHKTLTNITKSLNRILKEYEPDNVYFVFDNTNSRINYRKSLDSSYKSDRDRKPKFAYDTLELWKILLLHSADNYQICYKTGYEADDLVLPLLKILKSDSILLISADLDWARSIDNNCHWYNFRTLYDRHKFKDEFNFDPTGNSIKIYKAIKGDNSDNIPVGCPRLPLEILNRIVEQTSINLFYSEIDNLNWIPDVWKLRLKECKKRIILNYKLVDFIDEDIRDFVQECRSDALKLDVIKRNFGMVTSTLLW